MTVKELALKDGFKTLSMPDPEREIKGVYIGDLLSWVMGKASEGDVWITIMSNINTVAVASLADTACILLSEDVTLEKDITEVAIQKNVNILSCNLSSYGAAVFLSKII